MIAEWFVGMVLGLVVTLAQAVLPTVTPPTFDIAPAIGLAKSLDAGLPVSEAITGIGVLLAVLLATWGFALLRQVWRFVPVIGGG